MKQMTLQIFYRFLDREIFEESFASSNISEEQKGGGSIYVDSPDYGGMKLEDFAHIADIYSKYKDEDNIIVVSDHFMSDHRSWHYKVMQLNHKVYISGIKYQDPNTGIEGLVEAYVINENDTLAEDLIHCRVIATGFMFTTTSDKIIKG